MASKKPSKTAKNPNILEVNPIVEVLETTPFYYANFAEVSHSPNEFALSFARMPVKPSAAAIAEARASGTFTLEASVHIVFPLNLIDGLIKALEIQKQSYEKNTGMIIKMEGK